MRRALIATILFLALAADGKPKTYRVEPVNGTVGFSIVKWGVIREEGSFRNFVATVVYDPRNVAASRVDFTIDAKSIDTKNSTRDETLRSEDFLHVSRYPRLTFRSTRVVPAGTNAAQVTGDLTIRGVTRRVTIPVRLTGMAARKEGGDLAAFETSFVIDRRQFGVNGSRWSAGAPGILANQVSIRIVAGAVETGR